MHYDIILHGTGATFPAFAGALQEFAARGHSVRRLVGISGGAVVAGLMAAGYNADTLRDVMREKLPDGTPRFSSFIDLPEGFDHTYIHNSLMHTIFQDQDVPLVVQLSEENRTDSTSEQLLKLDEYRITAALMRSGGLCSGSTVLEWVKEKLSASSRCPGDATFAEFHRCSTLDLSLIISDTTTQEMLVLNHRTAPRCPVAWAVRMSMGIPFFWEEVRWQPSWGTYRGRDIAGHAIVDGSVLESFSADVLSSPDGESGALMGHADPDEAALLLLVIDETLPVADSEMAEELSGNSDGSGAIPVRRQKIIRHIKQLANTFSTLEKKYAGYGAEQVICRLPAQGYGAAEFDMSDSRVLALIAAGRNAMKNYFERF